MFSLMFGALLISFLIFVYPFLDVKFTKPLKERKDSNSRIPYYKFVIISEWTVTAIIIIYVFLSKANFINIGLTLPHLNQEFSGMLFGFLASFMIVGFMVMRIPLYKERFEKQVEEIDYLLPRNKVERNWSIFVAITAGICEEIIYRGFVIYFLSILPFNLSMISTLIIASLIFGFAHIYQGWKGFVMTAFVGFILSYIYLKTGSLLIPIILHILIDLRSLLFVKKLQKVDQGVISPSN